MAEVECRTFFDQFVGLLRDLANLSPAQRIEKLGDRLGQ
jgi:hypothetical protein